MGFRIGRRFVPTSTITRRMDRQDLRRQREARARAAQLLAPEILPYASVEIVHVDGTVTVLTPAPVTPVEQTIEDAERARFHSFITDPATGPLLDAMLADNDATDAAILADRENEAHWQSERDGDACSSACGFCGRCS